MFKLCVHKIYPFFPFLHFFLVILVFSITRIKLKTLTKLRLTISTLLGIGIIFFFLKEKQIIL